MQHVQAMCVAPYTIGDVKLGNPSSADYIILLQSRALQFTLSCIYDNENGILRWISSHQLISHSMITPCMRLWVWFIKFRNYKSSMRFPSYLNPYHNFLFLKLMSREFGYCAIPMIRFMCYWIFIEPYPLGKFVARFLASNSLWHRNGNNYHQSDDRASAVLLSGGYITAVCVIFSVPFRVGGKIIWGHHANKQESTLSSKWI